MNDRKPGFRPSIKGGDPATRYKLPWWLGFIIALVGALRPRHGRRSGTIHIPADTRQCGGERWKRTRAWRNPITVRG